MQVGDLMTRQVVRIHPDEPVSVAARTLTHYNIGALPVCKEDGSICGLVTDRDLVTRCLASDRQPEKTPVREVMTAAVHSVSPDMDAAVAAHLMGRKQVRRLPVVDGGKLCGIVSLCDLAATEENTMDAADALADMGSNIRMEKGLF